MELKNHSALAEPVADPQDARLEQFARHVVERRLEAPLLFILEAHLPLQTVLYHGGLLIAPLLKPLLGAELVAQVETVLSERRHLERVIDRIEALAAAREQSSAAAARQP